jgi:hypothetical protein
VFQRIRAGLAAGLLTVICLAVPLHGTTLYVPDHSATIQGAISAAFDGDSVIVRPGLYAETIDFLGKDIVVKSEQGAKVTTIDARFTGSTVRFESGETDAAVLDGFTLINGIGTVSFFSRYGGAILCRYNSSPTITRNILTGNAAYRGGAIWCYLSSPVISNNIIIDNSSTFGGGAISGDESSPLIANNTIMGNTSFDGGGIHFYDSSPYVTRNVIALNTASDRGGGLYFRGVSTPTVTNNVIVENSGGDFGGGAYIHNDAAPVIVNNTFVGNSASNGGGICASGSGANATISNTILRGDSASAGAEIYVGLLSTVTIDYSDVQGGQDSVSVFGTLNWGAGMLDVDPLFLDGVYHLQPGSPCIDAGDPLVTDTCLPPGMEWPFSDLGAYGGADNCWEPDLNLHMILVPETPTSVRRGGTLRFKSIILNNTSNLVGGDHWISAELPNSLEMLIPEVYLTYPNPFVGQVATLRFGVMANTLSVPSNAPLGSYDLIARIGLYPGTVIDEMRFPFTVQP